MQSVAGGASRLTLSFSPFLFYPSILLPPYRPPSPCARTSRTEVLSLFFRRILLRRSCVVVLFLHLLLLLLGDTRGSPVAVSETETRPYSVKTSADTRGNSRLILRKIISFASRFLRRYTQGGHMIALLEDLRNGTFLYALLVAHRYLRRVYPICDYVASRRCGPPTPRFRRTCVQKAEWAAAGPIPKQEGYCCCSK